LGTDRPRRESPTAQEGKPVERQDAKLLGRSLYWGPAQGLQKYLKATVARGRQSVKISEHPTPKVHNPHTQREAAHDDDTGRATESIGNMLMASEHLPSANDSQLGTLMVSDGLITDFQLQEALRAQSELAGYRPVGEILVEQKAISARQLNLFIDKHRKRARLGEVLLKTGIITGEQLEIALGYQKTTGLRLGEMLIKLNYIDEESMRQALCKHLNIPFIDLEKVAIDPGLRKLINKSYAKNNLVVPIAMIGKALTLVMDDPTNTSVVKELRSSTGLTINIATSTSAKIYHAFAKLYGEEVQGEQELNYGQELISDEESRELGKSKYIEEYQQTQRADEAVRKIINLAVKNRASDIHIESLDNRLLIRFRVDGVLQEFNLGTFQDAINKHRKEIISRIKILGKMDIAEKRRPQDGSFRVRVEKNGEIVTVDFRVSIIPVYYGENAVLRILDPRNAPKSIQQLGFSRAITEKLQQLLGRTTGIMLITGPTGSGKSSTLYAALMTLFRPEIRILTAENPIEYVYENLSQCEVNEKIGNTFANYLRAFLRHDPEVIMLGEIRDQETAEMAFRAAQTGHMLLSTLHTNDAISAVTRLLDLNIEANMITSSLLGVHAQRLVRRVCEHCKEDYMPSEELLKEFFSVPPADVRWLKGKGCPQCNFTGYKGRMAVAELWTPSEDDIVLINKGVPFDEIKASAQKNTILMAEDAMEKLRAGKTTLEELMRTLPYSSIEQFCRFSNSLTSEVTR
jgi:type II secretory ATPase GspE/PulE/Tfp pilus assembly ATPase PilB-like protein